MRCERIQKILVILLLASGVGAEDAFVAPEVSARGAYASSSITAMMLAGRHRAAAILDHGKKLFEAGEYPRAAAAFSDVMAIEDLPQAVAAEARLMLGHTKRLEGEYAAALDILNGITRMPGAPVAYRAEAQYHIGRMYMLEGAMSAVPAFGKVLAIPDAPTEFTGRALLMLGRLAFENHEDEEAERFLQSAMELRDMHPEDAAWTRFWLGRLAFRRGSHAAAREFYRLASAIKPDDPMSHAAIHAMVLLNLADVLCAENNRAAALATWRALADMPAAPMHLRLAAQSQLDRDAGAARPAQSEKGLDLDFSVWAEAFAAQAERLYVSESPVLTLFGERLSLRPGERWLEFFAHLRAPVAPPGKLKLKIQLYDSRNDRSAAEIYTGALSAWGWLRVDLRRHGLERARLRVELYDGRNLLDAAELFLSAPMPAAPDTSPADMPGKRCPVVLDAHAGVPAPVNWPVAFGAPFAAGELWDLADLRLVNNAGMEIPCQKEITGRWADGGSIQWALFNALVSPAEGCNIEMRPARAAPAAPLRVAEKKGVLTVDTGVARYVLAPGKSPVREIFLGGRRMAFCGPQSRGLYVMTHDGRLAQAASDNTMEIETCGPLNVCVRFEGVYREQSSGASRGRPMARHITRVEFFAGQAWARVAHTLASGEDTGAASFKEAGWEFDAAIRGDAHKSRAPRASFGAERANPRNIVVVDLDTPVSSAYMRQERHHRFYSDAAHCVVMRGDAGARHVLAYIGAEMGDWAMLDGAAGGLMLACRAGTLRHPVEFDVHPNRIALKLFGDRAGEELDFRASAQARWWNLETWRRLDMRASFRKIYERAPLDAGVGIDRNAAGVATTHDLLVAPMSPAPTHAMMAAAARLAHLHSFPVYAQVDPWRICNSRALGAVYPCSPEKFPVAETMIEAVWRARLSAGHETGGWFVDDCRMPGRDVDACDQAYVPRHDGWPVCVRTWNRALREFTENTTRAYLDNCFHHWNAPGKNAGLHTVGLRRFQWLYQIAGDRRGADAVRGFGEGLKAAWRAAVSTEEFLNDRRNVSAGPAWLALQMLRQSYSFNWDLELRFLANDARRVICGQNVGTDMTQNLPRVSSVISPHGMNRFFHDETGRPWVPAVLDFQMRRACALYGDDPGKISLMDDAGAAFILRDMPMIMDVLERCAAAGTPPVSYLAIGECDEHVRVIVRKSHGRALNVRLHSGMSGDVTGGNIKLAPLFDDRAGYDQAFVTEWNAGTACVYLPASAPGVDYVIEDEKAGAHLVFADQAAPMVIHAPSFWRLPALRPAMPVYFRAPTESAPERMPRILVEGGAKFFDPHGNPWRDGAILRGWVDLPGDRPGLWRFDPEEARLVRAVNLPPFFAMGRPEFYFEPDVPWTYQTATPAKP